MSPDTLELPGPRAALNQAEAIESLLVRLENAARQVREPADFFHQLLHDLVGALSANSGAVWSETDEGLLCMQRVGAAPGTTGSLTEDAERRLAAAALLDLESRLLAPGAESPGGEARNDSTFLQCLAPRGAEGVPGIVLRIALRPDASLGARETATGLLAAAAEIALTFQLQHRLRTLHVHELLWKELDAAARSIHSARTYRDCVRAIAEQVRRVTRSDRVSVLVRRGSKCRLAAISSATETDRRARQVRLLERMATESVRGAEGFEIRIGEPASAARRTEAIDAYLDETQLRSVRCEILAGPDRSAAPVGCLVLDGFTGSPSMDWSLPLQVLVPHCAAALERALREQSRGLRRLLNPWRSISSAAAWLTFIGLLVAACVSLAVIPADLTIEATGRLMPVHRRGIFAPADAIVTEIMVNDGSQVAASQPLIRLTDPELDLEHSRLSGELQTAMARLNAVQARRKLRLRDRDVDASLLSIEEEELNATVAGLERQLEVAVRQRERLTVASPIRGRVARWDLTEVLNSLPVRHGQLLMDVFDPDGPWQLELEVPDDVSGYVRLATQAAAPRVDYVFQTDPGRVITSTLTRFEEATEINVKGELVVRGFVDLPADTSQGRQRGASVTARIYCGRRSLGFVWFREAIEFVQRHVLF